MSQYAWWFNRLCDQISHFTWKIPISNVHQSLLCFDHLFDLLLLSNATLSRVRKILIIQFFALFSQPESRTFIKSDVHWLKEWPIRFIFVNQQFERKGANQKPNVIPKMNSFSFFNFSFGNYLCFDWFNANLTIQNMEYVCHCHCHSSHHSVGWWWLSQDHFETKLSKSSSQQRCLLEKNWF